MNAEIKAKWIAALKSGRFKQVGGGLKQEYASGEIGHCCLGVLCELAVEEGVINPAEPEEAINGYAVFDGSTGTLPDSVQQWAGLKSCDPMVVTGIAKDYSFDGDDRPLDHSLSELNDDGTDFERIADFIQKSL